LKKQNGETPGLGLKRVGELASVGPDGKVRKEREGAQKGLGTDRRSSKKRRMKLFADKGHQRIRKRKETGNGRG